MSCFQGLFYLFDPGSDQNLAPLVQAGTPALSTLSPNPNRVKGYRKEARPITFYMPTWELADLEFVFGLEKDDNVDDKYDFDTQYCIFGGIVRRTLDYKRNSCQHSVLPSEDSIQKLVRKASHSHHHCFLPTGKMSFWSRVQDGSNQSSEWRTR